MTTAARAGTPPSGVNLLAIAGYSRTSDDLSPLMIDAQRWAAAVMESHLAYPMLAFFRSSHDDQSWIGTLGTLLDAATLMMTTVDGVRDGQARIFYNVGRHATRDLSPILSASERRRRRVGIERAGVRARVRPAGGTPAMRCATATKPGRGLRLRGELRAAALLARALLRDSAAAMDRRPVDHHRVAATAKHGLKTRGPIRSGEETS